VVIPYETSTIAEASGAGITMHGTRSKKKKKRFYRFTKFTICKPNYNIYLCIFLAVIPVKPAPLPEGSGAGITMHSAASKKRDSQTVTFSIAITKLQEVNPDGSEVLSYDLQINNLTAAENIL
jgi:hypothetical protein